MRKKILNSLVTLFALTACASVQAQPTTGTFYVDSVEFDSSFNETGAFHTGDHSVANKHGIVNQDCSASYSGSGSWGNGYSTYAKFKFNLRFVPDVPLTWYNQFNALCVWKRTFVSPVNYLNYGPRFLYASANCSSGDSATLGIEGTLGLTILGLTSYSAPPNGWTVSSLGSASDEQGGSINFVKIGSAFYSSPIFSIDMDFLWSGAGIGSSPQATVNANVHGEMYIKQLGGQIIEN